MLPSNLKARPNPLAFLLPFVQVRAQEVLVAGMESLPDTFRFEANTTAAFYTALLVGLVYLVQGVGAKEEVGDASGPFQKLS